MIALAAAWFATVPWIVAPWPPEDANRFGPREFFLAGWYQHLEWKWYARDQIETCQFLGRPSQVRDWQEILAAEENLWSATWSAAWDSTLESVDPAKRLHEYRTFRLTLGREDFLGGRLPPLKSAPAGHDKENDPDECFP